METIAIALICTAVFGGIVALSVFIRQLLLSRDKLLNDQAQERALSQESMVLEKLRREMEDNKRFSSHHKLLGENRDAIQYLDQKIEELLNKKLALIKRYGEATLKTSAAIISGQEYRDRKEICDLLKNEIDNELKIYDAELEKLQTRRASLWDSNSELQKYLLDQEKFRNAKMDSLYHRHSSLLEKIFLRHMDNTEHVATKTLEESTKTYSLLTEPIRFLLQFFKLSTGADPGKASEERDSRDEVSDVERDINDDAQSETDEIDEDLESVVDYVN
ncbi:hypothetical protein [Legionella londiniensis]|uniref:Uncharacterized protein n=1 Tax=Legionella londiniensis TaxID=45068 RepID=A0A0W0VRQ3_9GAMM|nr:hypothetical protein [Legionella londiniensis]KTD22441.1 hypothetical protein Llon_0659 [Legionella londiniensis]STX92986.1 Uncharacterised protein [Legionella londiniensis]